MPNRALLFALIIVWLLPLTSRAAESCGRVGEWRLPGPAAAAISGTALLQSMAQRSVVLLGETHDSAEDHRWQLQTLAQLHSLQPQMAIGLEMVPVQLQAVLDEWLKGGLSEQVLLERLQWEKNWGYDPAFYLPILHFARMQAIPLLALNLDRDLIEAVGRKGRQAVEQADSGPKPPAALGQPTEPDPKYLELLRKVFAMHREKPQDETHFGYFVEAQMLWDLAMARGMQQWLQRHPDRLVVAILGMGHVRHGYGVAHQLRGLGIDKIGALLSWPQAADCRELKASYADALFIIRPLAEDPPRLGIAMDAHEQGVRIASVKPESLAAVSGLKEGDIITELAGRPVKSMQRLRSQVMRQPAGTWLPLVLLRDRERQDVIIRFPPEP
jgi:uncharacterized iron-regulated protein